MLKCRSVNDFHHAQDAYLNIVVGNTYFVKFTKNPANFIAEYRKDERKNNYHIAKIFDYDVKRNGETAWIAASDGGNAGTIKTVRKIMAKNSPLVTRMNFEAHGQIADATLYGACKATPENYLPLKTSDDRMSDVARYGGFNKVKGAYFFLVEHEQKGKKIRTLESMPIYLKDSIGSSKEMIEEYCREKLKLKNPDVRMIRIKVQSLVRRNGYLLYISGRSDKRLVVKNAVSLCLSQKWTNYIKKLEKRVSIEIDDDGITFENNVELYNVLLKKHINTIYAKRPNSVGEKLSNGRDKFEKLTVSDQCKVLMQIIQLTQIANLGADLSMIGESKETGKMLISKNVSDTDEFVLINQSPAGLYESEVDLRTI